MLKNVRPSGEEDIIISKIDTKLEEMRMWVIGSFFVTNVTHSSVYEQI